MTTRAALAARVLVCLALASCTSGATGPSVRDLAGQESTAAAPPTNGARAAPTPTRPTASGTAPTGTATTGSAPTESPTHPPGTPTLKPSPTEEAGPTGRTEVADVLRVVDGDTIVVALDGGSARVRYIGVDTPETVDAAAPVEWMGLEASDANRELVDGRRVVLEQDVSDTDRYGRLLRYVWLERSDGWVLVNLELLRRGFAQIVTYPPDVKYVDTYLAAERHARDRGLGLWGDPPVGGADPTRGPAPTTRVGGDCDPSYPTVCIPPSPPDLDCPDVDARRFTVLPPDPHRFDGDHDSIGCESG